jgi:hypothetical protein
MRNRRQTEAHRTGYVCGRGVAGREPGGRPGRLPSSPAARAIRGDSRGDRRDQAAGVDAPSRFRPGSDGGVPWDPCCGTASGGTSRKSNERSSRIER